MLSKITQVIEIISEIAAILFAQEIELEHLQEVEQGAMRTRGVTKVFLYILSPIYLLVVLYAIVSKSAAERALEKAFIDYMLHEALSFYEWRNAGEVFDRLEKARFPPRYAKMSEEKKRRDIFVGLIVLEQVLATKTRLENREEYIDCRLHYMQGHNERLDASKWKWKLGSEFDRLQKYSFYEQLCLGRQFVFLRGLAGNSRSSPPFLMSLLMPGFAR